MIPVIALGISAIVVFYYLVLRQKARWPPGPRGLPFIGNALQLDKGVQHTLTKWADQYGDIFKIRVLGQDIVVLSGAEEIHDAMVKYTDSFAGRPYSFRVDSLFGNEDGKRCLSVTFSSFSPHWAQLKKVTTNSMKMYGEGLAKLENITLEVLEDVVEEFMTSNGKDVNSSQTIGEAVANIIWTLLIGRRLPHSLLEEYIHFERWGEELLNPGGPGTELDLLPWLRFFPNKTWQEMQEYKLLRIKVKNALTAEREVDEEDRTGCLLEQLRYKAPSVLDPDGLPLLDEHVIKNQVLQVAIAGTSTTFATMKGFIAICVNYPQVQKNIQAQIDNVIGQKTPTLSDRSSLPLVEAAIFESLRYMSITPIMAPHMTTCDVKFHGFLFPKNTQVWLNVWHLHHDPRHWEEPWVFNPDRFLDADGNLLPPDHPTRKRLLAFGAGRRVCLGEALAKNRLFLFITTLLQKFTFLPPDGAPAPDCDPRHFKYSQVMRPEDYQVRIIPRFK